MNILIAERYVYNIIQLVKIQFEKINKFLKISLQAKVVKCNRSNYVIKHLFKTFVHNIAISITEFGMAVSELSVKSHDYNKIGPTQHELRERTVTQ